VFVTDQNPVTFEDSDCSEEARAMHTEYEGHTQPEASIVLNPVKRGRGRPRKNAEREFSTAGNVESFVTCGGSETLEEAQETYTEIEDDKPYGTANYEYETDESASTKYQSNETLDSGTLVQNPTKRGRGRPRKIIKDDDERKMKKTRGRPPGKKSSSSYQSPSGEIGDFGTRREEAGSLNEESYFGKFENVNDSCDPVDSHKAIKWTSVKLEVLDDWIETDDTPDVDCEFNY